MDSEKIINYHLYIDECGDQNLEAFSPTFPIFTLCGILVRDDLVPQLEGQVRALKQEFWGNRQIILHSRDIRKCQNGFEVLFDLDVKRRFYESINQLFRSAWRVCHCQLLHPERTLHSPVWTFQRCLWPVAVVCARTRHFLC